VGADGVVDVRNSYAVPHNEQGGQVYVDVEFHRAMVGGTSWWIAVDHGA
jgi:translation initiation factor 3 subunit F